MMRRLFVSLSVLLAGLALGVGPALAQTFNSGSTGADGAFNPTSSVTVTLPANGVFNFTTVTIPAGVIVRFARNQANTPVTILATGDVTVAGTIDVSGAAGRNGLLTTSLAPSAGAGGPGGFDGGAGANGIVGTTGGAGLGPGAGTGGTGNDAGGGSAGFLSAGVAGPTGFGVGGTGGIPYGAAPLLPLIGGSGGGGGGAAFGFTGGGGGGGGGALLIASSGTITVTGTILAQGGNGGPQTGQFPGDGAGAGGSGGAVRLVATTMTGSGGTINVNGGTNINRFGDVILAASAGRVRIETFTNTLAANFAGVQPSLAAPSFATLPNAPALQITSVAGVAAPATPTASFASPDITLPAATTNPVTVALAGANIPPGSAVTVRVQGQVGGVTTTTTTLSGTQASTTATASVTIPTDQPAVISATTSFTVTAANGGGPVYVQGEEVERVRVTAGFGGPSQVAYVTKSGREIVVTPGR